MFLLWFRQLPLYGDGTPAPVPPPAEGRSSVTNTPVFPLVPLSYRVYVVLYILFHWSGTPVCSQLVFCMHFWVRRCIPNVSVERDVLRIHLLLHLLVLYMSVLYWSFISAKTDIMYTLFIILLLKTQEIVWLPMIQLISTYSYNKVICFSRLFLPHSAPLHRQERQSGTLETEV